MKTKQTYTQFQLVYAVLMSLALLWLTISAPFVYSHRQKVAQQDLVSKITSPNEVTEDETSDLLGSNTEEKVPDSTSFSEEYLHNHDKKAIPFTADLSNYRICEKAATYIAFHGEILVPPPNIA